MLNFGVKLCLLNARYLTYLRLEMKQWARALSTVARLSISSPAFRTPAYLFNAPSHRWTQMQKLLATGELRDEKVSADGFEKD